MLPQPTIARRTRSMIKAHLGRREAPTACSAHSQSRFNTTSTIVGSSVASELDRQRLQTAKREALAILRLVGHQLESRQPAHERVDGDLPFQDRKSTRLNSSHVAISYAVF